MRGAPTPFRPISRAAQHACVAAILILSAATLGGCASGSGGPANAYAMAPASDGATIAFEQIDGPPPQIFDRMVGVLDSESKLRSIAIVSREAPAAYRVRSYLSAQVVNGKSVVAWVFDVYDRNQQRALRLSGEEPIGRGGRDPWSNVDDMVLRKIAQAGFSGLASLLNGTAPAESAPPAAAPATRGPAVAAVEPVSPTSDGTSVAALGYTDH
ncbi:hypothetical protein SSBR45G_71350 [Bradyrhizobium sp. SSBR45G]|uniref:hypothetical protein n=1 Tax=unclassified Bradyrhizobium TaxID=2631580 RepID=UPI0023428FEB|nr:MULTISPECIES: hypothetical protein [unclassified Bradyrhizobium]GLH82226.1 hypothetical protein SSBR45G_71350 [Bradyrhizobium sp. SSBR45G]GLH89696.1 hypothetical protein SSBR45R_71570 [Bradyrhizobium sp. SSBR45R]